MSKTLRCATAEQNPTCAGCKIAGVEDGQMRAEIAEFGGEIRNALGVVVGKSEFPATDSDGFDALAIIIEGRLNAVKPSVAGYAVEAGIKAYNNESCVSA